MNKLRLIATAVLLTATLALADEKAGLEKGRALTKSLYQGEVDPIWSKFSDEMKNLLKTKATFEQFQKQVKQSLPEEKILKETVQEVGDSTLYSRWAKFKSSTTPFLVQWSFKADGTITGMLVKPNQTPPAE